MATWVVRMRRVRISRWAKTAHFAPSGRESRAATAGIEDDRDRPPGAGRSGGLTGEATVGTDEGWEADIQPISVWGWDARHHGELWLGMVLTRTENFLTLPDCRY